MKRGRENGGTEGLDLAKCLMLLTQGLETKPRSHSSAPTNEAFECKTCNRKFPSFQALGGHRASHKRPRLEGTDHQVKLLSLVTSKPKTHECSICGQEFAMGQALGGHMRRHRAAVVGTNQSLPLFPVVSCLPVLKRSNSRRVFGLDLNLTPLENDLEYTFGKMAPKFDPRHVTV